MTVRQTKKKTPVQKYLAKIASEGGKSTLKKHGPEHFRAIVKKRWDKQKALKNS